MSSISNVIPITIKTVQEWTTDCPAPPAYPGAFTVSIHGSPEGNKWSTTSNKGGQHVSFQQIVSAILTAKSYEPGLPILLMSCYGAISLAQRIADKLNVPVLASPNKIQIQRTTRGTKISYLVQEKTWQGLKKVQWITYFPVEPF